jgi:hypothetical protein
LLWNRGYGLGAATGSCTHQARVGVHLSWRGIVAVDTEPKRTSQINRPMTMALIAASAADSDKRIKRLGWV